MKVHCSIKIDTVTKGFAQRKSIGPLLIHNHGNNILRLSDTSPNIFFTTSAMKCGYYK